MVTAVFKTDIYIYIYNYLTFTLEVTWEAGTHQQQCYSLSLIIIYVNLTSEDMKPHIIIINSSFILKWKFYNYNYMWLMNIV